MCAIVYLCIYGMLVTEMLSTNINIKGPSKITIKKQKLCHLTLMQAKMVLPQAWAFLLEKNDIGCAPRSWVGVVFFWGAGVRLVSGAVRHTDKQPLQ